MACAEGGASALVSGRLKMAWDEDNLYICAEANNPTDQKNAVPMEGRDENRYFHSKASDEREPYKSWLAKNAPGRSFAEVPYADNPESPRQPDLPALPFRRDRLQVGFDVTEGWHGMDGDADRVPYGFHAAPDTDYEFSLYGCDGGKSELWRHLGPGVPRVHDFPRQPRGKNTTGVVKGARHVVKRNGSVYLYEMAIPKSELPDLKLQAGTNFGFIFKTARAQAWNTEKTRLSPRTTVSACIRMGIPFQLRRALDAGELSRSRCAPGRRSGGLTLCPELVRFALWASAIS